MPPGSFKSTAAAACSCPGCSAVKLEQQSKQQQNLHTGESSCNVVLPRASRNPALLKLSVASPASLEALPIENGTNQNRCNRPALAHADTGSNMQRNITLLLVGPAASSS